MNFMICTHEVWSGDQMKQNDIGGTRGKHGGKEKLVLSFG
jgi:hypothetical protein